MSLNQSISSQNWLFYTSFIPPHYASDLAGGFNMSQLLCWFRLLNSSHPWLFAALWSQSKSGEMIPRRMTLKAMEKHNIPQHYQLLVGGLNPSEKFESQLGWWPIYRKIKHVSKHQPGCILLTSKYLLGKKHGWNAKTRHPGAESFPPTVGYGPTSSHHLLTIRANATS